MVKTKLASIKTISLSRLKLSATQNDYKRNRSRNSNDQVLNRLCVGDRNKTIKFSFSMEIVNMKITQQTFAGDE